MLLSFCRFAILHQKYTGKAPKSTGSNCPQHNTQCKMFNRKFSPPPTPRTIWVNHHNGRVKTIHRIESKTSVNDSGIFHHIRSIKFSLFQGRTDIQIYERYFRTVCYNFQLQRTAYKVNPSCVSSGLPKCITSLHEEWTDIWPLGSKFRWIIFASPYIVIVLR
jgi:hypothetical protein